MAIYHLHVKVIGRKSGSSAVASAAYRSGSRLRDERLDRNHDFSGKRGVVHSEVVLPENAPREWSECGSGSATPASRRASGKSYRSSLMVSPTNKLRRSSGLARPRYRFTAAASCAR